MEPMLVQTAVLTRVRNDVCRLDVDLAVAVDGGVLGVLGEQEQHIDDHGGASLLHPDHGHSHSRLLFLTTPVQMLFNDLDPGVERRALGSGLG